MTCAFGPCDQSVINGGPGCYLCDVIAALPQPDRIEQKRRPPPPPPKRRTNGKGEK